MEWSGVEWLYRPEIGQHITPRIDPNSLYYDKQSTRNTIKTTRAAGEAQKGSKLTPRCFESPDLGVKPFNLSNDLTKMTDEKSRKPDPSTKRASEVEKASKMTFLRPRDSTPLHSTPHDKCIRPPSRRSRQRSRRRSHRRSRRRSRPRSKKLICFESENAPAGLTSICI